MGTKKLFVALYGESGKMSKAQCYGYSDGTKRWYLGDKSHREDGPATIYKDGRVLWALYGIRSTEEQVFQYAVESGNREAIRNLIWKKWKDE